MDNNAILKRTLSVQKTYTFDESHNPRIPVEYWFQNSIEGYTLFVVFYTQACRYSKCEGCNLPSKMSINHVNFKDTMKQVDVLFHNILEETQKKSLQKIIISNNGSILDEATFSTTTLIYLISKINMECPQVKVVTLETRPEYVEIEELEVLSRVLHEGANSTSLELAIGFESFDETIRNEKFKKGLSLDAVEQIATDISAINQRISQRYGEKQSPIKLKTYFMLKPVVEMTNEEALLDIKNGIDFLHGLSNKFGFKINMHLNPTYVAKGTLLEKHFNENKYTPPTMQQTVEAVLQGENKNISIFVGLNDEGLAVEGGSFIRNDEDYKIASKLEIFNITQDYNRLKN